MSEPSLQGKDVLPAGRSLKRSLRGSIFKLQADVSSSAALLVNENTSSVLALSNFNHKHDGVGNFLVDCVKIYTLRHVANIVGKHANIGQCDKLHASAKCCEPSSKVSTTLISDSWLKFVTTPSALM